MATNKVRPGALTVRAQVWLYQGHAAWHFLTIPKTQAAQIRFFAGEKRRGWGSVRVAVTLGTTRWKTSVFPDGKAGTYLLPLKAEVRKKESVAVGDTVTITLALEGV